MSIERELQLINEASNATKKTKGYARLAALFDEGSFNEIDAFAKSGDEPAEVVAGFGTIEGMTVYAFSQNEEIAGGAISRAQSAKIKKIYEFAVKTGCPVVGIYSSNGARLLEGNDILSAYGDMLLWTNNLSGVVPQLSLVMGPCVGTSAMIASSADIVILKKDTPFTLDITGKSEEKDNGTVHIECDDEAAVTAKARQIISMLPMNNLSLALLCEFAEPNTAITEKADAKTMITSVSDAESFVEFQANFGAQAVVGLASIGGSTVGIIAMNGEKIDADSSAKISRTVRFCDAFAIPVITFADAPEFTSLREASQVAHSYAEATTAKIAIVTGEVYGSAFIAFAGKSANADLTLAWPNAVISPLQPEPATIILWNNKMSDMKYPVAERKALVDEYKSTLGSALNAAADGIIDGVITADQTRAKLISALEMLAGKRVSRLPKKHSNIQL